MYVVAGASGYTGAATANSLLAQKQPVTVLVREAAKGESWRAKGAQVAIADLRDTEALTAVLHGAQGAYFLNPPAYVAAYTNGDPIGEARRIGASIARAIDESKLAHAVALSGNGAWLSHGAGIEKTLNVFEEELKRIGRPITFVRASAFMQNQSSVVELARTQGILPSMLQPLDRRIQMVDVADVGHVASEVLIAGPKSERSVVEIAGPELYSPNDVATVLSQLYGRTVQAVAPPREQWVPILMQGGLSEGVAELVAQMFDATNDGTLRFEDPNRVIFGTSTLEEALTRDFGVLATH